MRDDDLKVIAETILGLSGRELRGFSVPKASGAPPRSWHRADVHRFALEVASVEDFISLILETLPARSTAAGGGTRWEYEFDFRGVPCRLRSTKSGLKLEVWEVGHDPDELRSLQREVEQRLTRAARSLYDRAIRPLVRRELGINRAQVINQYGRYRGMVDYFLGQLRHQQAAGASAVVPEREAGSPDEVVEHALQAMQVAIRHDQELAYLCTAFLSAYFSYVHHACVILSAFSTKALAEGFSIKELFGSEWAQQFDAAFPEPRSVLVQQAKASLGYLAKSHRNRLLHGGGGPSDGLAIEWAPGRHAIVTSDGEPTTRFMLWQAPLSGPEVEDIIERVAAIDTAIASHAFFPWLRDGLPADFRPDAVRRALEVQRNGRADAYTRGADGVYERELNGD